MEETNSTPIQLLPSNTIHHTRQLITSITETTCKNEEPASEGCSEDLLTTYLSEMHREINEVCGISDVH